MKVTDRDRRIFELRAQAIEEWERVHGPPLVIPRFQEKALELHFKHLATSTWGVRHRGGLTSDPEDQLPLFEEVFDTEGLDWALIGGLAALHYHVEPRETVDLDFVVDRL